MIHFTAEGIFADTEEEKLEFYDQMHRGDPTIWGHIQLWRLQCEVLQGIVIKEETNAPTR